MQLSERAKQLIPQARIVSFASWKSFYPEQVLGIFQAADDESRYLTDEDLENLLKLVPTLSPSLEVVKILRDNAPSLITQARAEVLAHFSGITEPEGELYPAARAEACWRDFWHFLRCITYGISGQNTHFTSPEGLQAMRLLYQELAVPLGAMVYGLEQLKRYSLEQFSHEQAESLAPYFAQLIDALKQFF